MVVEERKSMSRRFSFGVVGAPIPQGGKADEQDALASGVVDRPLPRD